MSGFIKSILSIIVAAAAVLFALGNRQEASVILSPLHDPLNLPVYLLGLGAMLIGFLIGAAIAWLNGHETRKSNRKQSKALRALEAQLDKQDKDKHKTMPSLLFLEKEDTAG